MIFIFFIYMYRIHIIVYFSLKGFQLIILPQNNKNQSNTPGSSAVPTISSVMRGRQTESEPKEEYLLSIGRIFHKISLFDNCITVTRYRPR